MLGILAGNSLALNSSPVGTLGCTSCGATLQAGPGRATKDGSLGASIQQGAGRAYRDGALGGAMRQGSGRAYRDGVLGALGLVNISSDLLVGVGVGAIAGYFLLKKFK